MRLSHMLIRFGALASALLSGTLFTGCPMYGVYAMYGPEPAYGIPTPPHDPTVQITDFSYTPASPIRVGDELLLVVELNKPTGAGYVYAAIGNLPSATPTLRDDGLPPDTQPDDGRYACSMLWGPGLPLLDAAPVTAHLAWFDGAPDLTRDAPPLTVLPAEEGQ